MGIKWVYGISAGAAPAGIGTGATGWSLPCPLTLSKDEAGSLPEHWWSHRVGSMQGCDGWEGLAAT